MIEFAQKIDMRSRKKMTEYLKNHFRYFTANSWNRSTSYACNLKIYKLGLSREIENKLYEMTESQEFFDYLRDLLDEFNEQHNYRWQAGMNGRNGGYLVLYHGFCEPSQYRSHCTHCGQNNFSSVTEIGNICGKCKRPTRVDYTVVPVSTSVYPGRGTDDGEDFEDWSMSELRERVSLVQELDSLADRLVKQAVSIAENYSVEDEEYYVAKTRKVLVPV